MRIERNQSLSSTPSGFTLAELLVVIALIGMMLAVALPALVNITAAAKLDAAASGVHSATKLARQYARTHNQPTYLVFHHDRNAYALFTINTHTNPVTQAEGDFLSNWNPLPSGIVFDDTINTSTNNQGNVFTESTQGWDGGFNRNRQLLIDSETYPALGFKPRGMQQYVNDIYLAEGIYDAMGALIYTSKQGLRVRLDPTGKSRIESVLYENGTLVEWSK